MCYFSRIQGIIVTISYLEGHHDCTRECIQIDESYNLSICGIRGLCLVGSGVRDWGSLAIQASICGHYRYNLALPFYDKVCF